MEIGPHVFEKYGRQTHGQTDAAALYAYIEVVDQEKDLGIIYKFRFKVLTAISLCL